MWPIVVGFGGRTKSGKTYLSTKVALELGWKRASFGDRVREVARFRGADPSDVPNLLTIGEELVTTDCEGFCEDVLEAAGWNGRRSVILDGVRHLIVVNTIKKIIEPLQFRLVFVSASEETRKNRFRKEFQSTPDLISAIDSHSAGRDAEHLKRIADLVVAMDGQAVPNLIPHTAGVIRDWEKTTALDET